jgi:Flp pilus assembly protein TadD
MNRALHRLTGRTGLLVCAWSVAISAAPVRGQLAPNVAPVPPAPAQFDPSDVYFQGYLLSREADELAAQKKFSKSLEKYQQAQQLFGRIHTYFPAWKNDMVDERKGKTQKAIDEVAPQALKEQDRARASIAEFEGKRAGDTSQGDLSKPAPGTPDPSDTLATRHIAELEGKVRDLQQKLREGTPPGRPETNGASRDASRVEDIARQKDLLQSDLKQANDELTRLRSRFDQPMQEEMQKLNSRIQGLEGENAATKQALAESLKETQKAKQQIDALQKERTSLMQQQADLTQALNTERKTHNEVVEGQEKQKRQMQEALREKDAQLEEANGRIKHLESQLADMAANAKDLLVERDSLLGEKEQMSALLKLNEGGQLRELIDQNMGLAKQLREATEKVDRLNADNNEKNNDYASALNDLVMAKTAINNFKREKQSQDKRIEELEQRLQSEDKNLAENPAADPAEAEVLRKIIQKQLRQQDRRRESRELLLQAIGEKSKNDPAIASAMELFNASEVPLTTDELKWVDGHPDIQILSKVPRSKDQVDASTAELERETTPYKKAAQHAFVNEHLQSARELLELASQANPGDIQAICSLGVINLRLGNTPGAAAAAVENFRRAVELDSRNPYAQRMLGKSLMEAGPEAGPGAAVEAEGAFKRAVELAPTNPNNHIVLGKFFFETGREKEAEDELKAAITCDDVMNEPYYNLAVLYAQQGKKKKGLESYQSALERGCGPDFDLEKQLADPH